MQHYDGIVIGSGQAGNPLAIDLANAGWKVALIEKAHPGGTCVNTGCTPTKTLIASAHAAYLARRAGDFGVHTGEVRVNFREVRERKDAMVQESRESLWKGLDKVEVFIGEGAFTASKSVRVMMNDDSTRDLTADHIFINTGSRAKRIPIDGIDRVPVLDEASLMELDQLPEHLLIIGGGYIGLEFGQMFCRFGSRVTIIESGSQLAPKEDPDVAEAIAEILREDGIQIYLETNTRQARRLPEGQIVLKLQTPDGEETLTGSHLLMAVGRTPNTESLNLSAAGIETDERGYIRVNERLETCIRGIYALGEVNGSPAFTHIAFDDFRVIRSNLLRGEAATTSGRMLPYTMYIDPQLGRLGITETEARQQGRAVKVAKLLMSRVARAKEVGETHGFMKVLVDAHTDQILGCAILGYQGGEMMSMLQIAMMGKLPYTVLKDAIFAHPTLAEALNNLFTILA
jgi:pyruvate/2-oxoglutarate dehydrogenase complex dihydrolipoamide dehydrogenase (E3) component